MKLRWRSLTARLQILFLLLAILPALVVGYLAYDFGRQSIISNLKAHLESVAILKEQEIKNWVLHLEHTTSWLAASPQITSGAGSLTVHTAGDPEYLAARDSLVAEFRRITALGHLSPVFLLDGASGQIVASSDASWEGRLRESEPWFIEGRTSIQVSDMFHSLSLGRPTMVIAAPVRNSDGQLLGVLAGHANLEALSAIMLERSGLGETGETFLVNRSNLLLTNSVFAPDGAFKKWIFGQGAERALTGESGVDLFTDYREQPVIGAYRWLEDRKLALIAKQDQAEALARVLALRNTVLGSGIGVALAVSLLGLAFARTITQPVRQLALGAGQIGRGNLGYRIGVKAQDEIGQLAWAFNQMAQDLQAITASRDELNREITERKRAEDALRIEKDNLKSIFGAMEDGVYVASAQYDIQYVNPALTRDFGAFEGSKCYEYLHDRTEVCPWCKNSEVLAGETVHWEWYSVKSQKTYDLIDTPLQNPDGSISKLELFRDITERKRAEEALQEYSERLEELVEERTTELRDAQERLIRQEKLAVLGQLAGGVGHELRNPLGAIKNAAYYLNMVLEDPDVNTRKMLEVLDKEVDIADKIISGLLNYARTMPPSRRTVDVNDVVQETLSRVALPEAAAVDVVLQLDEDLPPIMADPDQLIQVLDNIVRNGIQAMTGGGCLTVQTAMEGPEWVTVSIADAGEGISEENLSKIFEPLFTTKAKGIGLGLAVVKTLVEGHGGTIRVESHVGKGSTFTVRLPSGADGAVDGEGA